MDNNNFSNINELTDEELIRLLIQLFDEMNNDEVRAVTAIAEASQIINHQAQIIFDFVTAYNSTVNAIEHIVSNYFDEDLQIFLSLTNPMLMQCRITYPRLESNKGFWEIWHPNLIDDEVDNTRPTMTYKYHYRVTKRTFTWLCQLLSQHSESQLVAHNATPIYQQVATVLWRIGSCHLGYMMVKSFLGFSQGSYNKFTNRFLNAMSDLSSQIITWPISQEEVNETAYDFEYPEGEFTSPEHKKLPGCIGVLDGKLINIYRPRRDAESFRDRKGNLSMNLIAVCDSSQRFTYIYVGESGRTHDARAFYRSELKEYCQNPDIYFKNDTFMLADSGFRLRNNCLVPFKGRELEVDDPIVRIDRSKYNTLQSSMRTGIERCFAQLVGRWRFLFKYVYIKDMKKIIKVIITACMLHNICKNMYDRDTYENHLFRIQGHQDYLQGNTGISITPNDANGTDPTQSDAEEEEDQIAGYNKRERLLNDAKEYSSYWVSSTRNA